MLLVILSILKEQGVETFFCPLNNFTISLISQNNLVTSINISWWHYELTSKQQQQYSSFFYFFAQIELSPR